MATAEAHIRVAPCAGVAKAGPEAAAHKAGPTGPLLLVHHRLVTVRALMCPHVHYRLCNRNCILDLSLRRGLLRELLVAISHGLTVVDWLRWILSHWLSHHGSRLIVNNLGLRGHLAWERLVGVRICHMLILIIISIPFPNIHIQ